jgi:hypothetical protein
MIVVDVGVGYGGLLGLLHSVNQRRVTGQVGSTEFGGNLNVFDQFCE